MAAKKELGHGAIKRGTRTRLGTAAGERAKIKASEFKDMSLDELDQFVKLKKDQFRLRFHAASGQLPKTERVREIRRDVARVMSLAREKRAAVEIASEFENLRHRVTQLEAEQTRLMRALEAEGLTASPTAQAGAQNEPFALPDPVADRAPRNPRVARLKERLRTASAEEIAARAERADEERLATLKGDSGKR